MVLMVKMETKDCLVLPERKGIPGGGVIKALMDAKEKGEMLEFEATRVNQDGTTSREDPKERRETLGPWVSLGEMGRLEGLENPGRAAALGEGDQQELRATRVVQASRALWESRGPEEDRAHLVPLVLQA